ncbi:MAG: GNAT family N-acetyltransferase [Imperialibacter sp.]
MLVADRGNSGNMEVNFYQNGRGLERRQWAFKPLLFQSMAFMENQFPDGGYVSFTLERNGKVYGAIHFFIDNDGWVSMPRSPFGGLSVAQEVGEQYIQALVGRIIGESSGHQVTVYSPFAEYPTTAGNMFARCLLEAGFFTQFSDLHQHIPVTPADQLKEKMHASQVRRLNKCLNAGFIFAEESLEKLGEVYSFIEDCRKEQGVAINISESILRRSWVNLEGVYRAFTIRDGQLIVAACITTHVSDKVLYYFLPAASTAYNNYSPMVMLIDRLHGWAAERGYALIDMGKSSVRGESQKGLFSFKEKMGAEVGFAACLRLLR